MDMLREASAILGTSAEELVRVSKIKGLEKVLGDILPEDIKRLSDFESVLSKIAGNAFFDSSIGGYAINIEADGKILTKSVAEINPEDLSKLSAINENVELKDINKQLILSNETLGNQIERLIESFKRFVIPERTYLEVGKMLLPITQELRTGLDGNLIAENVKALLESLDHSITDTMGKNFERFTGTDFSAENLLEVMSKDLTNIRMGIERLVEILNFPFSFELPKPLKFLSDYMTPGGLTNNFIMKPMFDWLLKPKKGDGDDLGLNTQSMSPINYNTFLSQRGMDFMPGGNRGARIDFGEFKGEIRLSSSDGEKVDALDAQDVFKKIKPELDIFIRDRIYFEFDNNTKYNPKYTK
jgi:hypothetical protein